MGNTLRLLYSGCCKPCVAGGSDSGGSHAVSALARDLLYFAITSQVPEGLSNRVVSSKKAQANWYRNLLLAWKESKPPPRTPEQASTLVLLTLEKRQKADVEGFLAFYGLPLPHTLLGITAGVPAQVSQTVQFELQTRPVDPRAVTDGDSITAYVSTSDPRESSSVPQEVLVATIKRSEARAVRNYDRADALHETIIESGYRMFRDQNKEVLARKYRIQLRGIDAPEISMPYGQEAMEELKRIIGGHPLRVLVYGEDQYHRLVGDVYCNGKFVQELMLKRGMAWHYTAFDQRPKLAKWEKKARVKRVGLWASSNPEKPWEWRKNNLSEGR